MALASHLYLFMQLEGVVEMENQKINKKSRVGRKLLKNLTCYLT